MTRQTCVTCRWWCGALTPDLIEWEDGLCRRFPPRLGLGWPVTAPDDWCGEHDTAPPDADEMFARRRKIPRDPPQPTKGWMDR